MSHLNLRDLAITYVPLNTTLDEHDLAFETFRDWREDVERQLIEIGMEEVGFGPHTPTMAAYVRFVGYNTLLQECPEFLQNLIDNMPPVPTVLPQTWYPRDYFIADIERLVRLKPWVFPHKRMMKLADDLFRHSNQLSSVAGNFASQAAYTA